MGLPPHHEMVLRAQSVLQQGVDESCATASIRLSECLAATPPEALRDLANGTNEVVTILLELSVPRKHETIQLLIDEAISMWARHALYVTTEAQKKDEEMGKRGADGKPALEAARTGRKVVQDAVSNGVAE